ncbi:MAG: tRNA pseudouridine(55) synthase TruB [Lachnospiraceae bacterium]|nr:tRNA pseudouridine(55) synthase TruB [Lachnospiraceae bacterium]
MYSGVINVYKEPGFTSFDVVAKLRGILKQKKIGHTGTLDPDAEGVLVVCLGKATKLCDILTDKDKQYEATLLLGRTTDTEDSSGQILSQRRVDVTEEEVREAIMSFVGEYDQIPPMYSAIKVNGKKLYELARQGLEIERQPRRVVIHEIEIQDICLPYVRFSVCCGKGTYIRSLCRDIGERLGCGGVMDKLIRSSVNAAGAGRKFTSEDALTLEEIEKLVGSPQPEECKAAKQPEKGDALLAHIIAIDELFPELDRYQVTEEGNGKLLNGNILKAEDFISGDAPNGDGEKRGRPKELDKCLVYDKDGRFTAIYQYNGKIHAWKADKMFL